MANFAYALGVLAGVAGIAFTAWTYMTCTCRQPEVQGSLFTGFILACAFMESLALIGFVVALAV